MNQEIRGSIFNSIFLTGGAMADIRSYMKEKEKRERRQEDYKDKIARHKLASFYRVVAVIAVLAVLGVFFFLQYQRHVYTDYDIIASVERQSVGGAVDVRLGDAILTYSKDGAHCTDVKGNVTWNQTFEIQDVRLSVSGNSLAIGEYNGRNIYLANAENLLGQITTTMPVRDLAVSEAGYVTAILADGDVTWINTYNSSGEMVRDGRTHMDDSGYPMALSLSPNGELLCVAYVYVDAGVLRTEVVFYNFGDVGSNYGDHLVSGWAYTDMLIPYVKFINDETSFAVGDSRLMIYTGALVPGSPVEHLYDREIQYVFSSDRYIGLVFLSDSSESRYQLKVYDTADARPENVKDFYFDLEYTDIFFQKDKFILYNETECQIMTLDGVEKFRGSFPKPVRMMLPVGNGYKYLLVTDDSMDTIQLK